MIHSIIGNDSNTPLLFLITRLQTPPKPEELENVAEMEDHCNSDKIANNISLTISKKLKALSKNQEEAKQSKAVSLENLGKQKEDLNHFKEALYKLEETIKNRTSSQLGKLQKPLLPFLFDKNIVESKKDIIELLGVLVTIPATIDDRISGFIYKMGKSVETQTNKMEKERWMLQLIADENNILNRDIKTFVDKMDEIYKELNDQDSVIKFLEKIKKEDIFIIRGYKLDNKWHDHKGKILQKLNQICSLKCTINNELLMNGESKTFAQIKEWVRTQSVDITNIMRAIYSLTNKIKTLKIENTEIEQQINSETDLLESILSNSNSEDNLSLIGPISNAIGDLNTQINTQNGFLKQKENIVKDIENEIRSIEN